ncbi:hypothetical protein Afil01_16470 [Actinorhabdospora filicis]|uniref:Mce-associated membrane protein n=1 Tax=Actinorhabdospora filicis TaxID=1785913 RepID=A0A9W6SGR3_9ACTN|nr:hypothetical protein [Actinorhabdospora filicis]GLZ76840.1 hypothetical protein Afil01_16470 [Actinorhabdospora filicis]
MKKESAYERAPLWIVVVVVLSLIGAGAVALGAWKGWDLYESNRADGLEQEALDAAGQLVTNFMTTSATSVDADLARIVEGATGEFGDQFKNGQAALKETIVANKAASVGKVLSKAILHGDPVYQTDTDSAGVIVACDAQVSNVNAPDGRLLHYRVKLGLTLGGDGVWRISKLEFVG